METIPQEFKQAQKYLLYNDQEFAALDEVIPSDFTEFNQWIGLPYHEGRQYGLLPFQLETHNRILKHKHCVINKFVGAGMTEFIPRIMLNLMLAHPEIPHAQFAIITGIRLKLTVQIMEHRIKSLVEQFHPEIIKEWNKTDATLRLSNDTYFRGYPTDNIDAIRGQDDLMFVFVDEAAFFNPNDQEKIKMALERYETKTDPWIIWNSTPNGPQGEFFTLYTNALASKNDYDPITLNYTLGLGNLLNQKTIEKIKNDPLKGRLFDQEYNNQFIAPMGALFPEIIDTIKSPREILL